MNFEIIDNIFQVIVFSLIIVADIVCWFLHKNRLYIILALAHSCFMMGTLYFVLYLVIRGKVPQFFYVSEISWIASYLFLHSYQIVGYKGQRMKISVIPLICGIGVAIISIWSGIFGPAILSTGVVGVSSMLVFAIIAVYIYHRWSNYKCFAGLGAVWGLLFAAIMRLPETKILFLFEYLPLL